MSGSLPVLPLSRLSRNSRRLLCSRSLCPGPRLRRHGVRGGRRAQGSFKGKPLGRSNGREMFGRRIRPSVRIRPGERAVVRAGREGLNAGSERAYIVFGRQGTLFRPHVRPGSGRGLQRALFAGGGGIRIHRGHSRGSVRILGNARGVLLRRDRPAGSCGGRRGRARPCRRHPAKRGGVCASISSGRGDRDAIAGDGAAGACLPPEAGAETSSLACAGGGVCAVGAASASGCLPRGGAETAGACGRAEAEREAAVAGAGVPGLRQRAPRGSGKTSITTRRASGRLTM